MTGKNTKNIHWQLNNNQYEFRTDCVQFKDENAPNQFSGATGNGADCHVQDLNSDTNTYGYLLKVYKKGTNNWLALDPWIMNG